MFSSSIPPLKDETRIAAEAANMFADMLANAILDSDVSEDKKICVRICKQVRQLHKAVDTIMDRFAEPTPGKDAENYETRKQVLEYLALVEVGLTQFMETTKLPIEK